MPTGKQPMSQPLRPVSNRWAIRSLRAWEPRAAAVLAVALVAALAPAPGRVTVSAPLADLMMTAQTTLFAPMANAQQAMEVEAAVRLHQLLASGKATASALLAELTMIAQIPTFAARASVRHRKSDVASSRLCIRDSLSSRCRGQYAKLN